MALARRKIVKIKVAAHQSHPLRLHQSIKSALLPENLWFRLALSPLSMTGDAICVFLGDGAYTQILYSLRYHNGPHNHHLTGQIGCQVKSVDFWVLDLTDAPSRITIRFPPHWHGL